MFLKFTRWEVWVLVVCKSLGERCWPPLRSSNLQMLDTWNERWKWKRKTKICKMSRHPAFCSLFYKLVCKTSHVSVSKDLQVLETWNIHQENISIKNKDNQNFKLATSLVCNLHNCLWITCTLDRNISMCKIVTIRISLKCKVQTSQGVNLKLYSFIFYQDETLVKILTPCDL